MLTQILARISIVVHSEVLIPVPFQVLNLVLILVQIIVPIVVQISGQVAAEFGVQSVVQIVVQIEVLNLGQIQEQKCVQ